MNYEKNLISHYCVDYRSPGNLKTVKSEKTDKLDNDNKFNLEEQDANPPACEEHSEAIEVLNYKKKEHYILGAILIIFAIVLSACVSTYLYMQIENLASLNLILIGSFNTLTQIVY